MNAMENSSLPTRKGNRRKPVELLKSCGKDNYKARKNTLKKKASELANLCNVEVCMICYWSDGNVELWPEDSDKAKSIITKYDEVTKKGNPKRKADLNLSDYSKKKMKLDHDDDHKNSDKGIVDWDELLGNLSKECLINLSNYLETKIQILGDKIDELFMIKAKGEEEKLLVGQISTHHCDHEFPSSSDILNMITFTADQTDNYNMVDNLLIQPPHLSLGVPVDYSEDATTLVPSESTIVADNINEVAWPSETDNYYPEIGTSCSSSTSNANASAGSDSYCWSQLLGVNYSVEADEDFGTHSFLMDENFGITNSNNNGTTTGFDKEIWSENGTTSTATSYTGIVSTHSHDSCSNAMLQPNSCFGSSTMDELGLMRSLNNIDNFLLDNSHYESSVIGMKKTVDKVFV